MIQFGNDKIKDIYVGSDKIKEVYYGSEKVWGEIESIQDGYWVHKDTGVKTYFGADADFITDGVMSRPSWIANAKEIRLCTGITEFEVTHYSDPEWGDFDWCIVFHFIPDGPTYGGNDVLEKIDFGNAEVEVTHESLFYLATALTEAILNDNVVSINSHTFSGCESLECVDIGSGVEHIGYFVFGNCLNLDLVYIRATTPPTGEWLYEFGTINTNLQLKVPPASVNAYLAAITDTNLKTKVTAI